MDNIGKSDRLNAEWVVQRYNFHPLLGGGTNIVCYSVTREAAQREADRLAAERGSGYSVSKVDNPITLLI